LSNFFGFEGGTGEGAKLLAPPPNCATMQKSKTFGCLFAKGDYLQ